MAKYEALVRIRVKQPKEIDATPVDYLTKACADPDLGVLVLGVKLLGEREPVPGSYLAQVHVRVGQPIEFKKMTPEDYLRINLTDEDFGLAVDLVSVIPPEPN